MGDDQLPLGPTLQPSELLGRRRAGFLARNVLGTIALASGIAGLVAAVLPPVWIDPPTRSAELKRALVQVALGRPDLQNAAYDAALRNWQRAAAVLGLVAVVLAVIAGIRRQHRVLVMSALGLGAAALLWQYLLAALIVAIILMVIAGLLN
jgi:hypothetical protein